MAYKYFTIYCDSIIIYLPSQKNQWLLHWRFFFFSDDLLLIIILIDCLFYFLFKNNGIINLLFKAKLLKLTFKGFHINSLF
jgi:hypothetical protein